MSDAPRPTIRADKWLWFARFFKSRGLATQMISAGQLRVNGQRAAKPSVAIGAGDVLTFAQADRIRVVRLLSVATRRGPAPEAQALYEDLTPAEERSRDNVPQNPRFEGKGRPTGKDRRMLDLSRQRPLE